MIAFTTRTATAAPHYGRLRGSTVAAPSGEQARALATELLACADAPQQAGG